MNINLSAFGELLRGIREELGLSLENVSKLSYIHMESIRRIESGRVIPKFETLELLTPIYKKDLNSLFLKHRLNDYAYYYEIQNRIELKFDRDESYSLTIELIELKELIKYVKNPFYKNLIHQLILLIKAVILYKDNNNHNEALNKLINAIEITTTNFSLEIYKSFVYSIMEIRILMNIAFVLNRLKQKEKYLELLEFCFQSVDFYDEIFPKICHNLAGVYRRNKNFSKALEITNLGIKSSQETRNFNGLNLLFYGKGISEYFLNMEEYKESILTSICLSKSFGQTVLQEKIEKNCREVFGIELD